MHSGLVSCRTIMQKEDENQYKSQAKAVVMITYKLVS